jgi:hypothetical protein
VKPHPSCLVKKLDNIPEVHFHVSSSQHVPLTIVERDLIGQFIRIWPSLKSMDSMVEGFMPFYFKSKEDMDLILRNGPYSFDTRIIYLDIWTRDFDP